VSDGGVQRGFSLLPVAGAEFAGPQGIQHAEDLLRVAAHREIVDRDETDDIVRIHHEAGALSHAFRGVQDAQLLAEFAFHIGQHGEGQIFQIGVVLAPGQMHEFGIGAAAEHLRVGGPGTHRGSGSVSNFRGLTA
jgi:hypothetical protein